MIGAILAGGSARRLGGGDKGGRVVGGLPILTRAAISLRGQCSAVVLSANGDPARFADLDLPVVPDGLPGGQGPLAGLLAVLDHVAKFDPDARFVVTVPTDTPFLPDDLVTRLDEARVAGTAMIACAESGGRVHHTIALWTIDLRNDLRRALVVEGVRKVGAFIARHGSARAEWPVTPFDPFFNVNTAADLVEAERIAATLVAL